MCSYVCKSEPKVVQDLVRQLIEKLQENLECNPRSILLSVGNAILSSRIISAQEAVFYLLQLKLVDSSRATVFIFCNFAEFRRKVFRQDFLRENADRLLSGSLDAEELASAFKLNIIDYYKLRPKKAHFNQMSLSFFASWYRVCGRKNNAELLLDGDTYICRKKVMSCIRTNKTSLRQDEELFYLRLLMLHYPFRDEHELVSGCNSAKQSFAAKMNSMDANAISSEYLLDDLMGAIQQMRVIVPQEDLQFQTEPEDKQFAENFVISKYNMPDREFFDKVSKLSDDQNKVYEMIRGCLVDQHNATSKKKLHLFVSGQAGTGKSYLIELISELSERVFNPDIDPSVVRCSFTGSASRNIRGWTLHKAFMLPLDMNKYTQYRQLSPERLQQFRKLYKQLKVLIIDEISMVSLYILYFVHRRLSDIFECNDWFGGVNVIALGDFYQIKPVFAPFIFQVHQDMPFNLWNELFSVVELKLVIRQKGDPEFSVICSRVRSASFIADDVKILQTRVNVHETDSTFENALRVYPRRDDVALYNETCLRKLSANAGVQILRISSIDERCQAKTELFSRSADLPKWLNISVGARVMLLRAVREEPDLTNGTIGTVIAVSVKNGDSDYVRICFETPNGTLTHNVRRVCVPMLNETGKLVRRSQFPISLSWAATIHKVQGLTVKKLIADLGDGIFQPAMAYVALTRVRSLKDLSFTCFTPNSLRCYKCVTDYYKKCMHNP